MNEFARIRLAAHLARVRVRPRLRERRSIPARDKPHVAHVRSLARRLPSPTVAFVSHSIRIPRPVRERPKSASSRRPRPHRARAVVAASSDRRGRASTHLYSRSLARARALASRARRRRASPRRRRPSPRPVGASVRLARSRARRVAAASRRVAARSRRDRRIRARPRSRAPSSVARRSRARDGPRAMASSACGDGADVATARDARSRTRVEKQIILARCAVSRHVNVRDFFYLFRTRGRDGGCGLVAREGVDGGFGHSETG